MIIIHKEHKAVELGELSPGKCFFSEAGALFMITMAFDDVTDTVKCVNMHDGSLHDMLQETIAHGCEIVSIEIKDI